MVDSVGVTPNLYILGARRAGTASLAHYLEQHPAIHFTQPRDPAFFLCDELYQRGPAYYSRTFCRGAAKTPWLGEASSAYFAAPGIVGPRIAKHCGDQPPKFIVLLREPVARAWSHYLACRHHGYEKRDFAAALAQEGKADAADGVDSDARDRTARYFAEGCYAQLLHKWQEHFALDRFLFILSEDLIANPLAQVQQIFKWLGVDTTMPISVSKRLNVARYSRSQKLIDLLNNPPQWARNLGEQLWPEAWQRKRIQHSLRERLQRPYPVLPALDPDIATDLRQRYRGEILALSKMLGRYLSHWLADEPAPSPQKRVLAG